MTVTAIARSGSPTTTADFDRVVVIHVLEHLPDLPAVIAEVQNVCSSRRGFLGRAAGRSGLAYDIARRFGRASVQGKQTRYRIAGLSAGEQYGFSAVSAR